MLRSFFHSLTVFASLASVAGHAATLSRQGQHFYADGAINGTPTRFLIDTGATVTAVPSSVAKAMNLQGACSPGTASTANGRVSTCTYQASIQFSNYATFGEVVVMPTLNEPLLGMNVLGKMHIEQRDNVMQMVPADSSITTGSAVPKMPLHMRLNMWEWMGILLFGMFLLLYLLDKRKNTASKVAYFANNSHTAPFSQLVAACLGDSAKAMRLVKFEQGKAPNLGLQEAARRALDSIQRDRH